MASTTETIELPSLGEDGEPCDPCGAPLAADQRYCLECGARRGEPRVPIELTRAGADGAAPGAARPRSRRLAAGRRGRDRDPRRDASRRRPDRARWRGRGRSAAGRDGGGTGRRRSPAAGAAGETVSNTGEVKSEWPEGTDGWTVELGTLPKDGTDAADVEAAKADVESQGASDVGVLDSDLYGSLPTGNYVIY